jgi:hypothetical protein
MHQRIDPADYNLSGKTVLERIGPRHLAIVIDRKSRIIMSDGRKILEKADRIRESESETKISLRTSAPVCGKTLKFLQEHDIEVI